MAAVVWSSEARSISHGLLQTHRRCQTAAHGRGVEFRSSKFKRLGVQKARSSKARSSEARSSEARQAEKSVNEFKNGKSACLCPADVGSDGSALFVPPSTGRKGRGRGRDGDPRLAPNGPGPEKISPVTPPYDNQTAGRWGRKRRERSECPV